MPVPSPFHPRTAALCTSFRWKDWAGYYAVCSYDHNPEREYVAFRQAAGLIDVTPLYKYEVRGKDAGRFLSQVMTRNIEKLAVGRVTYCCWCDDAGKVVDDGTVTRWDRHHYRVTAAEPSLRWFERAVQGQAVTIEDSSARIAGRSAKQSDAHERTTFEIKWAADLRLECPGAQRILPVV